MATLRWTGVPEAEVRMVTLRWTGVPEAEVRMVTLRWTGVPEAEVRMVTLRWTGVPEAEVRMVMLRWTGVPEAEVRMVEGTYEETKGRVVCGRGILEEFRVDVCLRQESALSQLLFIEVAEVISRKVSTRDILRKLLYANDLAVVADSEADLQED